MMLIYDISSSNTVDDTRKYESLKNRQKKPKESDNLNFALMLKISK